jgi:hypothetical protein
MGMIGMNEGAGAIGGAIRDGIGIQHGKRIAAIIAIGAVQEGEGIATA